jgi:2-amino-4-hydroxy-6-hydroxymethyldihydropteridine diphosphokinase
VSNKVKARKIAKAKKKTGKKSARMKKGESQIAYLGLGSNVGDREEYIEQACFLLSKKKGIDVLRRSSNYETEAEGKEDQPPFLNAAVMIKTTLTPQRLLGVISEIENTLGREREVEWGPRTIDIDILLLGEQIISEDDLQVPHPLMHERMFVLEPLKEIAPRVVHPVLEKSIVDLFEERKSELGRKYDDELPGFKNIRKGGYDDYERW